MLTALAALGFKQFGAALERADVAGGTDPARRLHEQGLAYVHFALEQPARFQLMFRREKLDTDDPELATAAKHSYEVLERAIRAATGIEDQQQLTASAYGLLLAIWSIVHGFSHLALDGQLRDSNGNPAERATILQQLLH